ncbi:MAG: phosphatidylserine decarboxylase [Spirochaetes bacterium]|nr:phosphatidylserine decarboxylase [Spirochaetota bacterium]
MNSSKSLVIFIYRIIPKSLISRIIGCIARIPLPRTVLNIIIRKYSRVYGVKDEHIIPPGGFKSFDEFFTRRLKEGSHPLDDAGTAALSPVDGRIDQLGEIRESTLIQAKGIEYSLQHLIPSDTYRKFLWGSFMTLYLSPGDYHRIHAPVSGVVTGYINLPGTLFTVQDWMVKGLKGLYVKNERIITYIESQAGLVGVCKIGAMNVGRITLSYCDTRTNRTFRRAREVFFEERARTPIRAGDEVGAFHLGSTVILLFQNNAIVFDDFKPGQTIRMGKRIGTLKNLQKKSEKSS